MYQLVSVAAKQSEHEGTAASADEDTLKKGILQTLQVEIQLQRNREELEAEVRAIESAPNFHEPPGPTLETLLRYQNANRRELQDLLGIFERARRIRLGES